MATFPNYQPDYGTSLDITPKVRKSSFGDGYTQRVKDGINNTPRKWSVTFTQVTSVIDEIETFLIATGGTTNFTWTPPRGATGKWCVEQNWTRSVANFGYETLTSVFEEDFGV